MAGKMTKQRKVSLQFSYRETHETRRQSWANLCCDSLLSILFFLGFSLSLHENFMPAVYLPVLLGIGCVACFFFTAILRSKRPLWPLLLFLAWLLVFAFVLQSDMLNGLRLSANHMGELLGRRFAQNYPLYDVTVAEDGYMLSATLFFVPVFFLLALVCSYLTRARDIVLSLLLFAVLIFAYVYLQQEIGVLWFALLVLAEVLLLAQRYDRHKNFYNGSGSACRWLAAATALLFALIAGLAFFLLSGSEESPLAERRTELFRTIDRQRYGFTEGLGMPDGDFTDLMPFEPSTDTALEVTQAVPESLWLRGYVGSTYTGSGWAREDNYEIYDYADVFYWLHADNFYGQKQLADAALVTGEESREKTFAMQVKNVGASSRNIYAPYEFVAADAEIMPANGIGDAALKSSGWQGRRAYSYYSLPNLVKRYPDVINELYKDDNENMLYVEPFLFVESNYAEYVYDTYTELPEDTEKWFDEHLANVLTQGEDTNYASIKQAIITYLTEQTTYSTKPRATGTGDFAYDFLLLNKSGYSVHYATAATLMFRYSGLPARYVEGYLLTPDDVEGAEENTVFRLDGTHAHAWTEVYQSGVGWIPVEVTPPYFGLMEEADSLEGVASPDDNPDESPVDVEDLVEEQPDRPEELEDRFVASQGFRRFILVVVLFLLLFLVLFLLRLYIKYRRWLRARLAICQAEDNNVAVTAMFASALEALKKLGQDSQGVWLIRVLSADVEEKTGVAVGQLESVFMIYEEAAYSGREVGDEKRQEMAEFVDAVHVLLKERFKGLKRLRVLRLLRLFRGHCPTNASRRDG